MRMGHDLLEKFALLYNISHRLHPHGFNFANILERICCSGLFMFDHPNLETCWVRADDLDRRPRAGPTLPNAPFPTTLRSLK